MPGITIHEARKRTQNNFAGTILDTVTETDGFYALISWVPSMTDTFEYKRRKGKIPGRWRAPGETINETDNPQISSVTTQLREMTNRVEINVYSNMFMGNMLDQDEEMTQVTEAMKDMARDVSKAAIDGRLMDTVVFLPGHNFPVNFLGPAGINPGPYYGYGFGPGNLRFEQATGKLYYSAPIDTKEGAPVTLTGPGLYLLRGDNDAFWIVVDVANVPAADATAQIQFSSSTKQPDGMYTLTDASMVIPAQGVNGDSMGYRVLDKLRTRMNKYGNREECAYVMHSNQFNSLKERARNLGGATIAEVNRGGLNFPSYDGVPIVVSDYVPSRPKGNSPSCRPVFCVNLNPDRGFFGLIPAPGVGPRALGFRSIALVNSRTVQPVMGFMWKQCGSDGTTNSDRDLISWFGAFGLRAPEALCRADDIADE